MVNKDLLEEELNTLKERGVILKPKKFNKDEFYNLFKKYKYYGMTENSYCCYGQKRCCWQDLIEEGVSNLTLEDVKWDILSTINNIKHEIRCRKDGERFYIYKDKENCIIYIYARDTIHQMDFNIWLSNDDRYSVY